MDSLLRERYSLCTTEEEKAQIAQKISNNYIEMANYKRENTGYSRKLR